MGKVRRVELALTTVGVLVALGWQLPTAFATATEPRSAVGSPPADGLPAGAPPAAFAPEPVLPTPEGWPFQDAFPRTSGTGRLLDGSFQWSDFVYDDYGARGATNRSATALSGTAGSYAYPAGERYGRNAADMFRIGIGLDDDATYWRVDWTSLIDAAVPIVAFAFDTDSSAQTGRHAGLRCRTSPHLESILN